MFSSLHIELGFDKFDLQFSLLDSPITELWIERMQSRESFTLDNPKRFYGFNSKEVEQEIAVTNIKKCIATINAYQHIISKPFTNIYDQDCLNYLHNIFERYHGLLDKQTENFWSRAPETVKQALSDLNIAVHRCESIVLGNLPRFVCTWFDMPKTKTIPLDMMQKFGVISPPWGSVCLNYVEIGKTLEDLANDNDRFIANDAFRPFNFYSADFNVGFYKSNPDLDRMYNYFTSHSEFFNKLGFSNFQDPQLLPLRFPVAVLSKNYNKEFILDQIRQRQYVNKVYLQ